MGSLWLAHGDTMDIFRYAEMKKKKDNKYKVIIALSLAWVVLVESAIPLSATSTSQKLQNASQQIDSLEDELERQEEELGNLDDYRTELSGDLADLNAQLDTMGQELVAMEEQLAQTQTQIEEIEDDIAELERISKQQYEDMKLRIRYSYENSQEDIITILLQSGSIEDFLDRAEYARAIQRYDREKLDEYNATLVQIQTDKQELETVLALEQETKAAQEEKMQQVDSLVRDKKEKIAQAEAQIAQTEEQMAKNQQELERQKAYEEELERQKAIEDAARLAELKKRAEKEKPSQKVVVPAEGDEALLAAIIECEAGSESYEGKLAVGSVVLNRVASSYFPNTVVAVLYQSGQFSPVASGRFATVLGRGAESSCLQAAREVLGGKRTIDALYFRRNNGLIEGTVIGNHVFY